VNGVNYQAFTLCNFLGTPATFSFLGPDILLIALFSNTLQFVFFPKVKRPSEKTVSKINLNIHSLNSQSYHSFTLEYVNNFKVLLSLMHITHHIMQLNFTVLNLKLCHRNGEYIYNSY
jgi:hypothetical protein